MKTKNQYLAGAHVSISQGFTAAIQQGTEIGCTAIQIFTKSNRQWNARSITPLQAQEFIEAQKKSKIRVVITHASYLINLGSRTEGVQQKSFNALIDEIRRCDQLQIPFLVLHPGTADGQDDERLKSIQHTGALINQALEKTSDCTTTVLLETMAGQGKSIGSTLEELAIMLDQVAHKNRIGICFDTCHTFAAGYDFSTLQNYNALFEKIDEIIGLRYLQAFHINDSKKECGSRVDRHENIGEGQIALQGFKILMNDPRFINIPKILETPVTTTALQDYTRNLQTLIGLID